MTGDSEKIYVRNDFTIVISTICFDFDIQFNKFLTIFKQAKEIVFLECQFYNPFKDIKFPDMSLVDKFYFTKCVFNESDQLTPFLLHVKKLHNQFKVIQVPSHSR